MICDERKCSGCAVCSDICPQEAILMKEDDLGAVHPVIDNYKCIDCGLCRNVCPQNNMVKKNKVQKCYAGKVLNYEERKDSASGGMAAFVYRWFLSHKENAIAFGVEFDQNMHAVYTSSVSLNDIRKFQGSKYVQAKSEKLYKNIENMLKQGRDVLIVGLPCQIAALYSYLNIKKITTDHLLTIDLLCHGVSPQAYLDEEMNAIKKKRGWCEIACLSFRSNRRFRNFHMYMEEKRRDHKTCTFNRYAWEDVYFYGFLSGATLRNNCYYCGFSTADRVADITLGDFIGLGSMPCSPAWEGSAENMSMILVNNEKGQKFMDEVLVGEGLLLKERPFAEAVEGGCSLREPFPIHKRRTCFENAYKEKGFMYAAKMAYGKELKRTTRKLGMKRIVSELVLKIIGDEKS